MKQWVWHYVVDIVLGVSVSYAVCSGVWLSVSEPLKAAFLYADGYIAVDVIIVLVVTRFPWRMALNVRRLAIHTVVVSEVQAVYANLQRYLWCPYS